MRRLIKKWLSGLLDAVEEMIGFNNSIPSLVADIGFSRPLQYGGYDSGGRPTGRIDPDNPFLPENRDRRIARAVLSLALPQLPDSKSEHDHEREVVKDQPERSAKMATKLRLIAMEFFLSMGGEAPAMQGLIPVDGFIGDDWRKPTHLAIKINRVSWLIPMSDLKEEVTDPEGDGIASGIWFVYQGDDQLFRQAVSDNFEVLLKKGGCYSREKEDPETL